MSGPDAPITASLEAKISGAADFDPARTQPLKPEVPINTRTLEQKVADATAVAQPPEKNAFLDIQEQPAKAAPPLSFFPHYGRRIPDEIDPGHSRYENSPGIELPENTLILLRMFPEIFSPALADTPVSQGELGPFVTSARERIGTEAGKARRLRQYLLPAVSSPDWEMSRESRQEALAIFSLLGTILDREQLLSAASAVKLELDNRGHNAKKFLSSLSDGPTPEPDAAEFFAKNPGLCVDKRGKEVMTISLNPAQRKALGVPGNYTADVVIECNPSQRMTAFQAAIETTWQMPRPTEVAAEAVIGIQNVLSTLVQQLQGPAE